ncbi:MAG: helix-turn-helix domain-containing protein [Gemmatimonadota bacterium]|nr:helix-turn-helix domain-containing protein [Gemmatimonadota bacterium]
MASIAAFAVNESLGGEINSALGDSGTVSVFARVADLLSRVEESEVSAVILTAAHDAGGGSALEAATVLREQHPLLWIILYHRSWDPDHEAILRIASVPSRVVWVGRGVTALRTVVAKALTTQPERRAALETELLFATYAPRRVREFLAVCTANTHHKLLPREAEAAMGIQGRTLRGRLNRAGWPPPRYVIAWCRLLHAMFLLDVLGRPAKQVASLLGYGSAAALNASIKRHVKLPSGMVLEEGGYPYLLDSFDRLLRAHAARRRWHPLREASDMGWTS